VTWTTPRTWTDGEVNTASQLNTHVRDNLLFLKTIRDDNGRLPALSGTYLTDLDGTNLTGVAKLAASNDFTAGTHVFSGGRLILPHGVDKYQDLGGGLRRGAWIEGLYLHHIASDQTTEYRYLGILVSTPAGAIVGSVWIDGNDLHYIDESGGDRKCLSAGISGHNDAAAKAGSTWVQTYVHWIRGTGAREMPGHGDVTHSDGTVHTDIAHSDSHGDAHGDAAHGDGAHSDVAHSDAAHTDVAHLDHNDGPGHADQHSDTPHSDISHSDVAHTDVAHSDVAHTDIAHSDIPAQSHSDHGDVTAQNQPTVVP